MSTFDRVNQLPDHGDSVILRDHPGYRLTFHRALRASNTLLVTFDSITSGISSSGFGTELARKLSYDHIFVAQRKRSQYQDLSLRDFTQLVLPYARTYKNVIAYGASLGGYCAVYYGGAIDAQIIAVSPHNSAHPLIRRHGFRHLPFAHSEIVQNPVARKPPVIIYDPMLSDDQTFIDELILPAYPDSRFARFPFAGHNVLLSLRLSGTISSFVTSLMEEDKILDVELKTSGSYLWHSQYGRFLTEHPQTTLVGENHLWRSLNLKYTKDALRALAHMMHTQGRSEDLAALERNAISHFSKRAKTPWWLPFPEAWLTGSPETVASAGTYHQHDPKPSKERVPLGDTKTLANQPGYRINLKRSKTPAKILLVCFGDSTSGLSKYGFGSELCRSRGYDYIYVAQKPSSHFQDLSLESFSAAVSPYAEGYERVAACGEKSGGYAALYYGGSIDARIVSSSPELPVSNTAGPQVLQGLTHRPLREVPAPTLPPVVAIDAGFPHIADSTLSEILGTFAGAEIVRLESAQDTLSNSLPATEVFQRIIVQLIEQDVGD